MSKHDNLFPDRTIAETSHFRLHGCSEGDWYITAKHNIGGPVGESLSYSVCYFPELRTLIDELRAELDDLLLQTVRHPNPGTLGWHRAPVFETDLADRRGLSLRFAIFKRDGYRCQICGRTAAEHGAVLEVDHKTPRAKGGTDDPSNLWTLCFECNRGKSDTYL